MSVELRPGEEIDGVFDLGAAVLHNRTTVTGTGPLDMTTDLIQWSYAAGFRLRSEVPELHRGTGPLLIRIQVTVESGRVGAIFVADDMQTVLGTSVERPSVESQSGLDVLIDPAPGSGWLILRNNAAGTATRCLVQSIRMFRVVEEPRGEQDELAGILNPNSGALDLEKLAIVVEQARASASLDGNILEVLRRRWSAVPAGLMDRRSTADLAGISDSELQALWTCVVREATTSGGYSVRGWYHDLYRDVLAKKRVLDVGSGLGIDGLTFALHGAHVTFVDIVQSNLRLLERLCCIFGIQNTNFLYLEDLPSLDALPGGFDVIWCQGSMINAPFSFMRREAAALLRHLPIGGRWIELAYPRERWAREGRMPFSEWGRVTDGEGTPWMEWYDLEKMRARLRPAEFEVVLHFNFHHDDFNWFDLIRRK